MSKALANRKPPHPAFTLLPAAEQYYDVEEYLVLDPPEGYRYELAGGYLVVTPPPNVGHQQLLADLLEMLRAYLRKHPVGVALPGVGLRMAGDRVRIPDLIVSRGPVTEELLLTVPPLVAIEILSPSTTSTDRRAKAQEYAAFGIDEYWLADPKKRRLERLALREGRYVAIERSAVLPGFQFP